MKKYESKQPSTLFLMIDANNLYNAGLWINFFLQKFDSSLMAK